MKNQETGVPPDGGDRELEEVEAGEERDCANSR